jgi:hypothetical protein
MLEGLKRLFKRTPRDPERLRAEAENRLRAEQEIRAAEQAKSEDRRGLEGAGGRAPTVLPALAASCPTHGGCERG